MSTVNENAEYMVIVTQDRRKIYIDMHDILNLQYGQIVQIDGLEGEYTVVLITWKESLSEPWQVFIHSDYQRVWNEFCQKKTEKPVQTEENDQKIEESV